MGSQLQPVTRGAVVDTKDGDFNKIGGSDKFLAVNGQLTISGTFTNYESADLAFSSDGLDPSIIYLTNKGIFNSSGQLTIGGSVVNDGVMNVGGTVVSGFPGTTFVNSNNASLTYSGERFLDLNQVTNFGEINIAKKSGGLLFYDGYIGGEGSSLNLNGGNCAIEGTTVNQANNNGRLYSGPSAHTYLTNLTNGVAGAIEIDGKLDITVGNSTNSGKLDINSGATFNVNNKGYLVNKGAGSIVNLGKIVNDGTIDIRQGSYTGNNVDNDGGKGTVIGKGTLSGSGTVVGDFDNHAIVSPGNSAGGHRFEGDFNHLVGGIKQIELGGTDNFDFNRIDTEHDFTEITGDLIINGGTLEVSLIDGFELGRNQEFIISKVDGEVIGTYSGLVEGALVGKFDSIYGPGIQQDLYITYKAGDGNDIGLFTTKTSNPESIQTDDGFTQFTDADDVLANQSDIKYRLMGGVDYLEVIGGNNYANGNMGEDTIILRGGFGEYLGGKGGDTFKVFDAEESTLISANRGADIITGSVSGVIYRAGKDDDVIAVSQGKAWGDLGNDVFRAVNGEGYAEIQDYTIGEDVVELAMDGSWSNVDSGLMFTDTTGDKLMLLLGINDIKQVTVV